MDTVSSNTNHAQQMTELYVKKVLAGNIGDARARLVASIERMGYDIIEEEPHIIARRGAKGWGGWYASADVLDYAMTLTVRLKPLSENSTRATFDYLIKHPMLNRGEKNIVVQEAKTIAALSKKQAIEKTCSACETESTDDSKFCRKCGAPLTSEQAELEVLRMMAEIRAGKTSVVAASILMIVSAILLVGAFLLSSAGLIRPGAFSLFFFLGGLAAVMAVISTFFGWNRMKRALETPETQTSRIPRYVPESIETGEFHELPPRRTPVSITEGTTNLLDEEWASRREKEKVPLSEKRDTNDLS